MNILFIIIYSVVDVFVFKNIDKIPVIGWSLTYKSRIIYPVYRVLQFILFAAGLWYLWQYTNWYHTAGYVLAFYLLTTDLLYYAFEWNWQGLLHLDEAKADCYWLCHFTQSGFWLLRKGFNFKRFMISSVAGLIILIITNLI